MTLKMGIVCNHITDQDVYKKLYGCLPIMASCSKDQIGDINAESYAERVNLTSKLVLTDGNSLLGDQKTEMIVLLSIKRDYMCFMGEHYGQQILKTKPFGMAVVTDTNESREHQ